VYSYHTSKNLILLGGNRKSESEKSFDLYQSRGLVGGDLCRWRVPRRQIHTEVGVIGDTATVRERAKESMLRRKYVNPRITNVSQAAHIRKKDQFPKDASKPNFHTRSSPRP